MKKLVYAIYDSKLETYNNPVVANTKGAMIREFVDIAKNEQHPVGKHPADYTLFEIGTYNDSSGKVEMHKAAINMGTALSLITEKED